jgi:hypothetical protein
MTTTNEVLVLFEGEYEPRCWCGSSPFGAHFHYHTAEGYYYFRADVECAQGHITTIIEPPQPLDDTMRDLLT